MATTRRQLQENAKASYKAKGINYIVSELFGCSFSIEILVMKKKKKRRGHFFYDVEKICVDFTTLKNYIYVEKCKHVTNKSIKLYPSPQLWLTVFNIY